VSAGFTPGPWVASDRTDGHEIYAAKWPGRPICHASSYWQGEGPRRDEREANARLIAAAPELYEAVADMIRLADMGLEESLREPQDSGNYAAYNRAKAALAKARGES
jgi:hypothetical protein